MTEPTMSTLTKEQAGKKAVPFWKRGIGDKTVTVDDGVAIFSESYTDKTIYERFEQPFKCSPDNLLDLSKNKRTI